MPPRDALILHMLSELENLGQGLTKWEEQFLQDRLDQHARGIKLTDEQFKKLKEIYEERVR